MTEGRSVFRGRVLHVRVERADYPDGSTGELEIVRHPGAAAVLPILRPEERCDGGTVTGVLLLRQYRHTMGGMIYEVPAGKLDEGEAPDVCARRELREEAGVTAGSIVHLATITTSPGFTDERVHLYAATELEFGAAEPERHEFIEPETVDFASALEMVADGRIEDAKTVASLLLAARWMPDAAGGGD